MAITLHTFATTAVFEAFRWDFIKRAEGVKVAPYIDHVGVPTIGVGFNLKDAGIRGLVFSQIDWVANDTRLSSPADIATNNGFISKLEAAVNKTYPPNDTASLQSAVNAILAQRAQALSGYGFIASNTSMVLTEAQMQPVFLLAVPEYHRRVRAALGLNITAWPDESREMVALTSMAYQGTLSRIKAGLSEAIANGDRAEAWYQIRYKAQVTGPGDRGRHFAEAQNFGLYDGANTGNPSISAAESKMTYKMLSAHRSEILDYEASYGSAAASNAASRFGVNTADVQLINVLTPAYTAFISYANTLQGTGLAGIDTSIISNAAAIYFQGDNAFTTLLDARVDDARTGNKLNNNLLVGGAGKDTAYGGAGSDHLIGAAGWDVLDGGTGDDVLVGGKDNDRLIGGAGMDTYAFNTGDGQDTIDDSDGNGRIVIGSTTLTGAGSAKYKLDGHKQVWTTGAGATEVIYTLDPSGKTLAITGAMVGANSKITVNNFDATKPNGYLGIKLETIKKIDLKEGGGSNPFNDPDYNPVNGSANVNEGNGKTFSIYLNAAAKAGETLTLALGALGDKFKAILGDSVVNADGAVITLAEGQTQVSFALVQEGEVTADAATALSVSYQGTDSSASSNSYAINLKDAGEVDNTFNGDFLVRTETSRVSIRRNDLQGQPVEVVAIGQIYYISDAEGNLVKGSEVPTLKPIYDQDGNVIGQEEIPSDDAVVTNNTIYGTAGIDKINGLTGQDALSGGAGNDQIDGGAGSDSIKGGAGNDHISSSAPMLAPQRRKPTDSWSPPGGEVVNASGATWGIYVGQDPDGEVVTYWDGIDNTPIGSTEGDVIDGGTGVSKTSHYRFRSCLRPYLLGKTSIRYRKTTQNVACCVRKNAASSGWSIGLAKTTPKAGVKFSSKVVGKYFVAALILFTGNAFSIENWDFAIQHKNQCSVGSQLEMNLCLEREKNKVELQLIAKNNRLQAALARPQDAVNANRTWLKFREQECRFATSGLAKGQSLYQFALHSCNIDLTQKRIRDLDTHIGADCNGCPPRKAMTSK